MWKLKIINFVKWCLRYKTPEYAKIDPFLNSMPVSDNYKFDIQTLETEIEFNEGDVIPDDKTIDLMIRDRLAEGISNKVKFKKEIRKDIIYDGQWSKGLLIVRAECKLAFIDISK